MVEGIGKEVIRRVHWNIIRNLVNRRINERYMSGSYGIAWEMINL